MSSLPLPGASIFKFQVSIFLLLFPRLICLLSLLPTVLIVNATPTLSHQHRESFVLLQEFFPVIIRPPARASSLMSSHLSPAGGEFLELANAHSRLWCRSQMDNCSKSLHRIFTCNYSNTEPSANKLHRKSTMVNMMVESSRLTNIPKLISKK